METVDDVFAAAGYGTTASITSFDIHGSQDGTHLRPNICVRYLWLGFKVLLRGSLVAA